MFFPFRPLIRINGSYVICRSEISHSAGNFRNPDFDGPAGISRHQNTVRPEFSRKKTDNPSLGIIRILLAFVVL